MIHATDTMLSLNNAHLPTIRDFASYDVDEVMGQEPGRTATNYKTPMYSNLVVGNPPSMDHHL